MPCELIVFLTRALPSAEDKFDKALDDNEAPHQLQQTQEERCEPWKACKYKKECGWMGHHNDGEWTQKFVFHWKEEVPSNVEKWERKNDPNDVVGSRIFFNILRIVLERIHDGKRDRTQFKYPIH